MFRSTGDHHQGLYYAPEYSYVIAIYTRTIESIGVWQYTIRSAVLPRTYLCPVQLHELVRYMKIFLLYKNRKFGNNVSNLPHCGPKSNCHYCTVQSASCDQSSSIESSTTRTSSLLPGSSGVSDGVGSRHAFYSISLKDQ